ncbi:MAG: hypothetical protein IJ418_08880 [Clostridia bacterium]|nr:hypothetical protein [Clostridia bacterium]
MKEVRYLGSTEYNLFLYPAGNKILGVCIGGFPCLEELKKLGDMLKGELESGMELSETFVDGARQIIAAIEAAGA